MFSSFPYQEVLISILQITHEVIILYFKPFTFITFFVMNPRGSWEKKQFQSPLSVLNLSAILLYSLPHPKPSHKVWNQSKLKLNIPSRRFLHFKKLGIFVKLVKYYRILVSKGERGSIFQGNIVPLRPFRSPGGFRQVKWYSPTV